MKHVLKFAVVGLLFFSFQAKSQIGDAVKGVIMNKKVQSTVLEVAEEKIESNDTVKKVTVAPSRGTSVDSTAAGFAINEPGLPNEKTTGNTPKGNAPASKAVLVPPPAGSGASNFAINDAGVPNEKTNSNNKTAVPTAKPEETPKTTESNPK